MASLTLEGTWEEVTRNAKQFVGRKVRITVLEEEISHEKNDRMLAALRKILERSKNMSVSSDTKTPEIIREARSGGMFGDDSGE